MNWQETISQIYSRGFDAELNVVSGTNAFFQAVSKERAVQESLRLMRGSGEVREDALGRIYDLVNLDSDQCYENPYDTRLAVLLWLTSYTDPHFARLGAHYVERAPRCWYAAKLAHQIINPPPAGGSDFQAAFYTQGQEVFSSSSKMESLNMVSPAGQARVGGLRLAGNSLTTISPTSSTTDVTSSITSGSLTMVSPTTKARDVTVPTDDGRYLSITK